MTTEFTFEDTSTVGVAHAVIDCIQTVDNNEKDDKTLSKIHNSLRTLIDHCNVSFMRADFQIELGEAPIEECQPDMKSWHIFCRKYIMVKFIIRAFEDLERLSDPQRFLLSSRCMETLSVILDYINLALFRSCKLGLKMQEKRQSGDKSNSSPNKSLAKSTHWLNGNDYYE